jgi:cytochrome c-type biogenesis protein CcmF
MPSLASIGQFALIAALLLAAIQATLPILGAQRGNASWIAVARPVARWQFVAVTTAFFCLAYSFVTNDFSVLNVATNSNSHLPLNYRFAATWGSHEGSLLLWTCMLAFWTAAVSKFSRHLPDVTVARVLGVMGTISVGFLLFMLTTSNPFIRLIPAPPDGRDLNPLLQDPGMVVHPPMLYMGYVGFSVAFSFAVAALIRGRLDATWAKWSRPWTLVAWTFLTCGIAMGSYWSYYVQGWGGWWFWDPVENASFMPWLVGTALIHSLAVTEKRGAFKSWTVLLAISAFSLSLLGTFLVRSGVLTSVHAFATDPKRGVFILCFLGIVIGGSLALYAWRAKEVGLGSPFDVVSRESLLLSNNVLLAVAAASVLLGTMYPLVIDALDLGKLSVGPPYFNTVFVSVMTPAMFLLGIGPIARWKKASIPELARRLQWALAASAIAAFVIPFYVEWKPLVSLGLLLAIWIAATGLLSLSDRLSGGEPHGMLSRLMSLPRAYWGMQVAHLGVAVVIVGIAVVTGYESEKNLRMEPGDVVSLGSYDFQFNGLRLVDGPNYEAVRANIEVFQNGVLKVRMHPEKRVYNVSGNALTSAAIDTGIFRDLYVSLGEPAGDNDGWSFRIQYKPFVDWIWAGAFLMAIGGLLALTDKRYVTTAVKKIAMREAA